MDDKTAWETKESEFLETLTEQIIEKMAAFYGEDIPARYALIVGRPESIEQPDEHNASSYMKLHSQVYSNMQNWALREIIPEIAVMLLREE